MLFEAKNSLYPTDSCCQLAFKCNLLSDFQMPNSCAVCLSIWRSDADYNYRISILFRLISMTPGQYICDEVFVFPFKQEC